LALHADLAGLTVRRRAAHRRLWRSAGFGVDTSAAVGALQPGGAVGVIHAGELALAASTVAARRTLGIIGTDPFADTSAVAARLVGRATLAGLTRRCVVSVGRVVVGVIGIGVGTAVSGVRIGRRLVGIVFGRRRACSPPADTVVGAIGIVLAPEGTLALETEGIPAAVGVLAARDSTDVVFTTPADATFGIL
jgi:hypothetical protein